MNANDSPLPPGQREVDEMPRFGLTPYAERFPNETRKILVEVGGKVETPASFGPELAKLERVSQVSDFHCVTTWTKRNVHWSGYRFVDIYEQIIRPMARPDPSAGLVVFRGQDGYRVGLPLDDLLQPDVLLADQLDDQPLPIAHGAPLRLVAPAHYGYKNAKHVASIHFHDDQYRYRRAAFRFMDHPRARVALEERGTIFPARLLRWLYRPFIPATRRQFADALEQHLAGKDESQGT